MTWSWRPSERQREVLAYLSEHPGAATIDVREACGLNATNSTSTLNNLYVQRLVVRYLPLSGFAQATWHLDEKGWKALQAPPEAPTPPAPRLLRPVGRPRRLGRPTIIPDRDIDAYWDEHPHLTWEQAKRAVQKLAGVAS